MTENTDARLRLTRQDSGTRHVHFGPIQARCRQVACDGTEPMAVLVQWSVHDVRFGPTAGQEAKAGERDRFLAHGFSCRRMTARLEAGRHVAL